MLPSSRPAAAFTQPQLKQLRAQCLVFVAFRNQLQPRKVHIEIALGGCAPAAQGESEIRAEEVAGETSSRSQASSSAARLPLLPISSLRLSSTPESHHHNSDDPTEHDE